MSKDGMNCEFLITNPGNNHWIDIAEFIAVSIPNALVSSLGKNFGALYYENISKHPLSCSYAALDKDGRLAGIILGTLDHNSTKRLDFVFIAKLLLAANFRLFSPAVFKWLISELCLRGGPKYQPQSFPKAELLIVAVHKDFKGKRLADKLINELESFFKKNNLEKPYLIRTEKSNGVANNVYKKLGAKFIKTYRYHGKLINEWHKSLSQ